MDNNNKFPEQEAPAKNTDDAYIKVGEDGNPKVPETDEKKEAINSTDNTTSLDRR